MSAMDVTAKTFFDRLWLVLGLCKIAPWVNCPYARTTPTVQLDNYFLISEQFFFPEWPLNFLLQWLMLLLLLCSFPDMRPATNSFSWYQSSILDWFPVDPPTFCLVAIFKVESKETGTGTRNMIQFTQKGCEVDGIPRISFLPGRDAARFEIWQGQFATQLAAMVMKVFTWSGHDEEYVLWCDSHCSCLARDICGN